MIKKLKKFFTNEDISFGFMWGSVFSSIMWFIFYNWILK